jgi:hypothetical protein
MDGGSKAVGNGSDEVGDPLGLDDLEDTKCGGRRDGREGSLKVVLGSRGSCVGWGVVGGDGHVGDWYEKGDVWVRGADGSRPGKKCGGRVAERDRGWRYSRGFRYVQIQGVRLVLVVELTVALLARKGGGDGVRVGGVRTLTREEFFKSVSGKRGVSEQGLEERSSLRIRGRSLPIE